MDDQDLQAIRVDYVRVRSGETHETGSLMFGGDGVSRAWSKELPRLECVVYYQAALGNDLSFS